MLASFVTRSTFIFVVIATKVVRQHPVQAVNFSHSLLADLMRCTNSISQAEQRGLYI